MSLCENRIMRPDLVSIGEDDFCDFNIDELSSHYDEVFGEKRKWQNFFVRWVFCIVLLWNKNTVLILAGSLASVPLNILTGFYTSSSFSLSDWILHLLQLTAAVLFYILFLRFVRYYLSIHEQGDRYVSDLYIKSPYHSGDSINKAVQNIEYFFCMKEYKNVKVTVMGILAFGIMLVLLLFIPPSCFGKFIQLCVNVIKGMLENISKIMFLYGGY